MNEPGPSAWIESIADIFDAVGVDWSLIGALAANRYRDTPRFTTDVDTLAEWHPDLVATIEAAGYEVTVIADPGEPPHLIRCYRGPEAIDILLPVVEYQREALDRAVDHRLQVEDVLIHKLIAWRHRDRDDIRSILATDPELNRAYLERWIEAWNVGERWAVATTTG